MSSFGRFCFFYSVFRLFIFPKLHFRVVCALYLLRNVPEYSVCQRLEAKGAGEMNIKGK